MGTDVEGKMVAALRRIGFDRVFDTDWAADLTIMEEAHELLDRVQNGGKLPLTHPPGHPMISIRRISYRSA